MLDEIGEMKPALQAKLLHVLQDAEFTKLGSNKRIQVDVRIVAATNRDLEKMMLSGDFREDLYYRLKVIELTVPPLRERPDEIPTLTDFFVARYSRKYNRPAAADLRRAAAAVPAVRLAGQHPRAREHDQAGVILQDEQLVVREIERNMQRARRRPHAWPRRPPPAAVAAAASAMPVGVGDPARCRLPSRRLSPTPTSRATSREPADEAAAARSRRSRRPRR